MQPMASNPAVVLLVTPLDQNIQTHPSANIVQVSPYHIKARRVPLCKHPERPVYARDMCGPCYQSARLNGKFRPNVRKNKRARTDNGEGAAGEESQPQSLCGHPERVHYAKSMCHQCYMKSWRKMNPKSAAKSKPRQKREAVAPSQLWLPTSPPAEPVAPHAMQLPCSPIYCHQVQPTQAVPGYGVAQNTHMMTPRVVSVTGATWYSAAMHAPRTQVSSLSLQTGVVGMMPNNIIPASAAGQIPIVKVATEPPSQPKTLNPEIAPEKSGEIDTTAQLEGSDCKLTMLYQLASLVKA